MPGATQLLPADLEHCLLWHVFNSEPMFLFMCILSALKILPSFSSLSKYFIQKLF